MSKFDMVVELMVKNGVTTKFSENLYKNLVNNKPIIELDFTKHDKVFKDKIAEQKNEISILKSLIDNYRDAESKLFDENQELKQRISELESKETEICKNEPKISDSAPSMEWYEGRHHADCNEIKKLNATIDVLIHKVEYLRQFAGLE